MTPRRRKRLDASAFALLEDTLRRGVYADGYAAVLAAALRGARHPTRVLLQVTSKQDGWLSGIDEAIAILRTGVEDWSRLVVNALYEGDPIEAWDTVMTVEGEFADFAHLETLCLGVLGQRTRVCTNVRTMVEAARKPVLFFGARDAHWATQPGDGFAAMVGGAREVATPAHASLWSGRALGTVRHTLIAAFGGNTVAATRQLAKQLDDEIPLLVAVDYENDCVRTSVDVARALGERLWAVRVDTPEYMVDRSVLPQMGTFRPTGVSPQLVWNVRNALDAEGFGDVQIVVSGGFDAERVQDFEDEGAPVDAYGIGAAAYHGTFDFTADVVLLDGKAQSRAGRQLRENPKLERVK